MKSLVEYFGDSFNNIFDKDASQIIKNIKDLCSSIPKFNTRNMYMSEVDFKHITSLYPINFYITETRGRLMLNQDKFNRNPREAFGTSNYVRLSTLKNVYYNSKNIVSTNIISPFEGDYNNSHKDIAQKTKDDEVIPIFLNFSAGKGIGHYDAIDWDILEETSPLTLNNVVNPEFDPFRIPPQRLGIFAGKGGKIIKKKKYNNENINKIKYYISKKYTMKRTLNI